jgi:hypothetical protein
MRGFALLAVIAALEARAAADTIRCDNQSTQDLSVDGLLDDWDRAVLAHVGANADGAVDLRCSWDGTALAFALDIKDDRIVRVRSGAAHEDRVDITIAAGSTPARIAVYPGNAIAKPKLAAPRRVAVADSLQPKGFSVEARVPAAALPGLSAATTQLALRVVFHDSDQATGGDDIDLAIDATVELGDRKDLLDDFLRTVKLKRTDVRVDTFAELDLDRRGKERLIAGGTVIGVLTDQFAFVSLPAARAADVKKVELLPLGPRGQQVVSALVRQTGNGGARDLLMLWTVWSGQLQPLVQIEVRKELGTNVLEATWRIAKGKKGPELVVEPKPAVGFTAETWNEVPAPDSDPIVLPWDTTKGGVVYTLAGAAIERRDLPPAKKKRP